LIAIVVGALAVVSINSLKNTQFSKNQALATKFAQDNLERVRTIKNANYGVCGQGESTNNCSTWNDIWPTQYGSGGTCNGCKFVIQDSCTVRTGEVRPFCLVYNQTRADLGDGFTSQITIEDEAASQKKVTSKVYWTDSSGEHSSDLITIFSKY
jgi:hypothetical protein